MIETRRTLTALAIVAALGFAGCGDDDNETSTTTSSTSNATGATGATGESGSAGTLPADFIAEADAICAEGDEEIDAAVEEAFGGGQAEPSDEEQAEFFTDVVAPRIQQQIDDLAALDPPEEGAEDFAALIDAANAALEELKSDPDALVNGADPFAEVEKLADELGLKECSS